jgi:vanillate/3-O-methylgallate O-demethylase
MISLGVIAKKLANPGTQVAVLWGPPGTVQKEIACTVRALPFKEDRRKTDLSKI